MHNVCVICSFLMSFLHKWKSGKQQSVISWTSPSISFFTCFARNCHVTLQAERKWAGLQLFLQKSFLSQTFKRQWISYSHLSKNSFPLPYPFWEDFVWFLSAAPFGCPWGKPGIGCCFHNLPKNFWLRLFLSLERGNPLTEFDLTQSVWHNVNREILL